MCQKIIYTDNNNSHLVSFKQYLTKIPVLLRNGSQKLFTWGKQDISNSLPLGGSVPLEKICSGEWDKYFPKPIKLPIKSFLVRDIEDNAKWFHLPSDKWIQGMLVNDENKIMVYVVTLPQNLDSIYPCWPRVMVGL